MPFNKYKRSLILIKSLEVNRTSFVQNKQIVLLLFLCWADYYALIIVKYFFTRFALSVGGEICQFSLPRNTQI